MALASITRGREHGELVAVEPGKKVRIAQRGAKHLRYSADQAITFLVAHQVVHYVQLVYIDMQQAVACIPVAGIRQRIDESGFEAATIHETGERVMMRVNDAACLLGHDLEQIAVPVREGIHTLPGDNGDQAYGGAMIILDRHRQDVLGPPGQQSLAVDLVVRVDDDAVDQRLDAVVDGGPEQLEQRIDVCGCCAAVHGVQSQRKVATYQCGDTDVEIVGGIVNQARQRFAAFLDLIDMLVRRVHEVQFLVPLRQFDGELIALGLQFELLLQERLRVSKSAT